MEKGSLYPALHRLEAKGWIAASWELSDNGKRACTVFFLARQFESHADCGAPADADGGGIVRAYACESIPWPPCATSSQAACGAANFGGSRPFEAALRRGDQRWLKSQLAAKIGGPTRPTLSGKLLYLARSTNPKLTSLCEKSD